ncbi:hypothetical protein SARC_00333 [Sphaeroforma arctica JP610]|uniref:Uncharacterized protein n=1 Tax=Sphaeroforma arctica JP610 TaxID=667725 RepID=A0A0L0GGX4_9EUKA|nr:hypothetical protein SARC_00333 [Sphaeroforma arctica JP610]KNC87568.1 hypothetical protein SARC_00333 [Sphaeroforma arctica JP610]|eukprot:XP_014161470.1 hypothetical protein SARC_00333 [Sphaeroforma arctica JP610]
MLHSRFYQEAERRFGKFTVDRFASAHNTHTDKYYTKIHNALQQKWAQEVNAWANPPWKLIPDILDEIIEEATSITICAPYYPNATWFPKFLSLLEEDPMLVEKTNNTFLKEGKKACGKTPWGVTLVVKIGVKCPYLDSTREQRAIHVAASEPVHSGDAPQATEYETRVNLIEQYHKLRIYTLEEPIHKLEAMDMVGLISNNMYTSSLTDAYHVSKIRYTKKEFHPLQSITATFPGDRVQVDTIGRATIGFQQRAHICVSMARCTLIRMSYYSDDGQMSGYYSTHASTNHV